MFLQADTQGGGLLRAALDERGVALAAGDIYELLQHLVEEETQPHAFALALFTDAVHAVVPIAAADQRQAVGAAGHAVLDGAHAVLVEAFLQRRALRQVVVGFFAGIQRAAFDVAHRLIEHAVVAADTHVAAGGQG